MAKHREEAIFREVRALGFHARFLRGLVEAGVVECKGGALREFLARESSSEPQRRALAVVLTIVIAPRMRSRARSGTAM
jgi:hypothetical protein